jgi:predicted aspartyl protease
MIEGWFGFESRPFIELTVRLTRLDLEVSAAFLVDTGADSTLLSGREWRRAGVERSTLKAPSQTIAGFGGFVDLSLEPAVLVLRHADGSEDLLSIDIEMGAEQPAGIPSVLGRDVLNRYRLVASPRENILTLETVGE